MLGSEALIRIDDLAAIATAVGCRLCAGAPVIPGAPTLQDIADAAHVHRSTVALALRDHPRIPERTRNRVKAVAERLGYRPNPMVTALMRYRRCGGQARREPIAYLTGCPTRSGGHTHYARRADIFAGASDRASDLGYNLEHLWLDADTRPERLARVFKTRGILGVLIGRMPSGRDTLELPWETVSAVALDYSLRAPCLHRVTGHHFEAAREGMQQCLRRGYRRVGFVHSGEEDGRAAAGRWLGGYLSQQHHFDERLPVCPGIPTTLPQFTLWLEGARPDALIVTHAEPVLAWLAALGLQVPRDLGLIELQDNANGARSGVRYDPAVIGAAAVEMLSGLIQRNETGIPQSMHEVMLSGVWHEGKTLPPRIGGRPVF